MQKFRVAELLGALSRALDLTEGQPSGHCVRSCWIGTNIGIEYGLNGHELSDLYYAILMKDLGCSSNAARICSLYLTDDLSFKHDFKQMGNSLPQAFKFILNHTGLHAGLAERFRALISVIRNGGEFSRELMETRCNQGADIARKLRFSEQVAEGIKNLDEHWDGRGLPDGLSGNQIPVISQIALMAQVIDVFHFDNGKDIAISEVRKRSGTWFSPELVAIFERAAEKSSLWDMLASPDIQTAIAEMEPGQVDLSADEDYLDDISIAFAKVIDAKSPFTSGHSERVALYTDLIAEQLGFDDDHRRWLKRGALLHDMGKLGVSNAILDKNGKPDDEEWAAIKMHPVYSYDILSTVPVFNDILPIVRGHHERLDGKGYPDGLKGDEITFETRIVTVADIFDALTADRPYRKAMSVPKVLDIMESDLEVALDPEIFNALKLALQKIGTSIAA